jgi:cardiolipin synthase
LGVADSSGLRDDIAMQSDEIDIAGGGAKHVFLQHLPNLVTALRIVAAGLIWLGVPLLAPEQLGRWFLRGLFLVAAVSDAVDGLLARKLRATGGFGFYLDPIADKLFLNTMCLFLAFSDKSPFPVRLPPWFAIGMLAKDVSWATGGLVTKWLTGRIDIPPSVMGKLTTLCISLLIAVPLATPELPPAAAQKVLWRGGVLVIALAAITLAGYAYQVFQSPGRSSGGDAGGSSAPV